VDGSASTAALILIAGAMAPLWQASLHLLHVANTPLSSEALRTTLGLEHTDLAGLVLDSCLGDPAEAILRTAAEQKSHLVIMGTHGQTANPAVTLGHVAERVLREARCPVLLVGLEAARSVAAPFTSPVHVLVPLNGTSFGATALAHITRPLSRVGALIDVLHVVSPVGTAEAGALTLPRYMDEPYHAWQAWRQEFASRLLHPHGVQPNRIRVGVGDPGDEIVRAARQLESQLILLAWKGTLDHDHAQTLRTVLRSAPCPVLVTRTEPRSAHPAPPVGGAANTTAVSS